TQVLDLPPFESVVNYAETLYAAAEEYPEGQAPLRPDWVNSHIHLDSAQGLGDESPMSVAAYLARHLLGDEALANHAAQAAKSALFVYVVESTSEEMHADLSVTNFRQLLSGEVVAAVGSGEFDVGDLVMM